MNKSYLNMTEITLKKDLQDIREIYFEDNRQRYFFGPTTKKQSFYLVLTICVYPFFTMYALDRKDSLLFILGTVFFSFLIYDFLKVARPIIKWKKSVETFLNAVGKSEVVRFIYNEEYFIHIQDKEELKQNWEILEKAIINERYIWLFSDTNVLLPKSSMSQNEYLALSEMITEKVRNVSKNHHD